MLRKKFNASSVFKKGSGDATIIEYPKSPVTTYGYQILSYNENLKANTTIFENCDFLVSIKNNQEIMKGSNGHHVVQNDRQLYVVSAFPAKNNMETRSGINVITPLPKGLVMHKKQAAVGEVYFFEGLNLALFDQAPTLN